MQHDAKTRAGKGGEKTEQPQRMVVYVVPSFHKSSSSDDEAVKNLRKSFHNYCLATYLMMLLCWWCRAALMFFFVLYDLVFFLAIKDDVDALVVLWLPRAFMPCNATACVERTFIFCPVRGFFFYAERKRTEQPLRAKRVHHSRKGTLLHLQEWKSVPFLGFFLGGEKREKRAVCKWMAERDPERHTNTKKRREKENAKKKSHTKGWKTA